MNHDAARATVWPGNPMDVRVTPYKAYGPRAFFRVPHNKFGVAGVMKTFVCQIEWPHHIDHLPVQIALQTYALVRSLVDKLKAKGWPVEAAYSDSFSNTPIDAASQTTMKPRGVRNMAQRLFTMEVRCDFRDPMPGEADPIELVKTIMQQAGRHIYSSAGLLGDRVKPTIVIYSHDWFKGHLDIPLFDDDIARGNVAITEAENVLAPEANVLTGVHLNLIPPPAPPKTHPTVIEHEPVTASVSVEPLTNPTAAEVDVVESLFSDAMLASLK